MNKDSLSMIEIVRNYELISLMEKQRVYKIYYIVGPLLTCWSRSRLISFASVDSSVWLISIPYEVKLTGAVRGN
jgi:hypothetical protein